MQNKLTATEILSRLDDTNRRYPFSMPKNTIIPKVSPFITDEQLYGDSFTSRGRMLNQTGCGSNQLNEKKELFIKNEPVVDVIHDLQLQVKWEGHFLLNRTYSEHSELGYAFSLETIEKLEKAIKLLKPIAKKYAARVRKEMKVNCKKQCDSI
jgi:hypothetical protein